MNQTDVAWFPSVSGRPSPTFSRMSVRVGRSCGAGSEQFAEYRPRKQYFIVFPAVFNRERNGAWTDEDMIVCMNPWKDAGNCAWVDVRFRSCLQEVVRGCSYSYIRSCANTCVHPSTWTRARAFDRECIHASGRKIIRHRGPRIDWPLLTAGGRPQGLPLSPRRCNIAPWKPCVAGVICVGFSMRETSDP